MTYVTLPIVSQQTLTLLLSPPPLLLGWTVLSYFGEWTFGKCDINLMCACAVGLVPELQGGAWEERVLVASAPSAWVPE